MNAAIQNMEATPASTTIENLGRSSSICYVKEDEVHLSQALGLGEGQFIVSKEAKHRIDVDASRHRIGGALLVICEVRGPGMDDTERRELAINHDPRSRTLPEEMIARYGAVADYHLTQGIYIEHIDLRPAAQVEGAKQWLPPSVNTWAAIKDPVVPPEYQKPSELPVDIIAPCEPSLAA